MKTTKLILTFIAILLLQTLYGQNLKPKLITPIGLPRLDKVEFSSNEKYILTSDGKNAKLWDANTGFLLRDYYNCDNIYFSPLNNYIITTTTYETYDTFLQTTNIYDIKTNKLIKTIDGRFLDISSDEKLVITNKPDNSFMYCKTSIINLVTNDTIRKNIYDCNVKFLPNSTNKYFNGSDIINLKTNDSINLNLNLKNWDFISDSLISAYSFYENNMEIYDIKGTRLTYLGEF